MTNERFWELLNNPVRELTDEEWQSGCHFCEEWDGLLVYPGSREFGYGACCRAAAERARAFKSQTPTAD